MSNHKKRAFTEFVARRYETLAVNRSTGIVQSIKDEEQRDTLEQNRAHATFIGINKSISQTSKHCFGAVFRKNEKMVQAFTFPTPSILFPAAGKKKK